MTKKNVRSDFASSITLSNGRVIYAKDYGYKAFPIFKKKKK